jgi:hypothetical protein
MKAAPEPLTEGGPARGRSEEKGSLGSDSSDDEDEEDEETLQGYDDPAMVGTRRAVCDAYLRGASGIVVVYDIGDAGTMDRLDGWLTRLEVRDLAEAGWHCPESVLKQRLALTHPHVSLLLL